MAAASGPALSLAAGDTVHAAGHLLLGMVAPLLLVLPRRITLALRALPVDRARVPPLRHRLGRRSAGHVLLQRRHRGGADGSPVPGVARSGAPAEARVVHSTPRLSTANRLQMAVRNHTPRNPANTASVIAATVSTTKATRSPPGTGPESALTRAMIPSRAGPASRGSPVDGCPLLPRLAAAAGWAGGRAATIRTDFTAPPLHCGPAG